MKKYIPKVGDTVRTIKHTGETSTGEGRVGIVKRVNNIRKVWVDFSDGSGGLYIKVIPHTKVNWDRFRDIFIWYKAGEISLIEALTKIDVFVFQYKTEEKN